MRESYYDRYKTELLTIVSILIPLVVSIVATTRVTESLGSKLPYVALALGYLAIGGYVVVLARTRRFLQDRSLSQVRQASAESNRYRDALDNAQTCYFFLGMSAEEFQRQIPIHDYFRERQAQGRSPLDIRILLLHPDSSHFAAKLHDVNWGADLRELVHRKKDIMRTLVHSFAAMPESFGTIEVRFFDSKSIWAMQFYDCSSRVAGVPDTMRLMPQVAGRHGKFSHVYELDNADPELFASFLGYFEGLWDQSLPSTPSGVFPDLYSTSGSILTTLVFDFDGTLVNSSEVKEGAFMHAMASCGGGAREQHERAYATHGTINRVELLRRSFADVHSRPPSEDESEALTAAYTRFFQTHLDGIHLFPGFHEFYNRFRHRYRFIISSNAPTDEIVELCQVLEIEQLFVRIYGHPKSKVAALRELLGEFGIEPGGVLCVGDRLEDGVVAETVGARFCRIDHTGTGPPGPGPEGAVNSFSELAAVLYDFDIGVGS